MTNINSGEIWKAIFAINTAMSTINSQENAFKDLKVLALYNSLVMSRDVIFEAAQSIDPTNFKD